MNKAKINKIFEIFSSRDPEPKTELEFENDYTLLTAVVLSAQSTDVQVNKATKKLFEKVKDPAKMVKLGEVKLKKYINTIGLFNSKAKNVINMSKILLEKYDGKVPVDFDKLVALPGVGRKTANVFLNCAYGYPVIGVDTHVFRVANRLGIVKEKDVLKTELALPKKIPKEWLVHAHHWMILHGRYVCKARKPECSKCDVRELCEFKEKSC